MHFTEIGQHSEIICKEVVNFSLQGDTVIIAHVSSLVGRKSRAADEEVTHKVANEEEDFSVF